MLQTFCLVFVEGDFLAIWLRKAMRLIPVILGGCCSVTHSGTLALFQLYSSHCHPGILGCLREDLKIPLHSCSLE